MGYKDKKPKSNSQAAYAVWRVSPKCNSFLEKLASATIRRDEVA
jgi:hypothetical protein